MEKLQSQLNENAPVLNTSVTAEMVEQISQTPAVKRRKDAFGIGSSVLAFAVAVVMLMSGKSKEAHADSATGFNIASPDSSIVEESKEIRYIDGIPVTVSSHEPAVATGISRRPEVLLNEPQTEFVKAFSDFLEQENKAAIVTSGTRTGESQLDIIKQRIEEKGASAKFPQLAGATLEDTGVWLKAWQWLRAKRVPVNAPADVKNNKGVSLVRTSLHLKGKAIDLIGTENLDQLYRQIAKFRASKTYRQSGVKIAGIVREPYCVHVSLS